VIKLLYEEGKRKSNSPLQELYQQGTQFNPVRCVTLNVDNMQTKGACFHLRSLYYLK
jgi:hypothetical protein